MTERPRHRGGMWFALRIGCCVAVGIVLAPARLSVQSNPIVVENALPGTSAWRIPPGRVANDTAGQIKGYASATSVNKGENITFYVSVNPAQTYTIDVYRIGWYGGLGGRLMEHVGPLVGIQEPICPTDPTTGMIECQWAPAYTLPTQPSWTSGIYLAVLTNAALYQNYIMFTVRDDSRVAPLLYQQPVTTYQAYNNYPYDGTTGKSLYAFNSYGATTMGGTKAAVKASFDRPYNSDGDCADWGHCFKRYEINFVRWMEMSGYDVTYSTDVDTHTNGARVLNYRGFLSVGHDEYWSKEMYDAVVAARDAGVNLAFFGANDIYWQIRFEPSSTGVPNRVMVCYRSASLDPEPDPIRKTVRFRDAPVNRPEQALMGVQFTSELLWKPEYDGHAPHVVANSGHWVYAGTGFLDGDSVPGIVGYEADRWFSGYPSPTAVSGTYTLLSQSPYIDKISNPDYSNASIYQAPSGAWVFASGTMGWTWALDNFGPRNVLDARIQLTTANILNRFGASPSGSFTIGASPASQTVTRGASTSYSVTISPTGGFTGPVTLNVSGLPGGASGSFSPNPAAASSTLTVTTSTITPSGTYTLTITGVSGSVTNTTTVSLVVITPADFTLSASPSSRMVTPNASTSYSVTITPMDGFTGLVTLSVSGLPGGASGSFSPNPATASSTLAVTTSPTTPTGTYTLTITGVSGSLTRTTTVLLTVTRVAYDNAASSGILWGATTVTTPSFIIGSGTNRAAMIMVAMSGNGATSITASLGGVSGTVIPGTDSGASATVRTLIFQVINPPSGAQTATVSWAGGTFNVDVGVITVSGADPVTPVTNGTFAASDSTPSTTRSVTVASNPGDLTASIGHTADTWAAPFTNQTLKWGVDAGLAGGDIGPGTGTTTHTWTDQYYWQSHAVSGANFKTATDGNFTIAASPSSQAVPPGGSASYSVTINPSGGFTDPVTLSVAGLPGDAGGSFSPNPATTSSTLSVTTSTSTPPGTYTLTITGVGGSLTRSTTVTLVVNPPPDFTLSASPSTRTVMPGASTSYSVAITPTGGFSGAVTLSVSGLPGGASGSFSPNPATAASTLSVTTSPTTPTGTYALTITGVSGGLTRTTTVSLTVSAVTQVTYDTAVSSGLRWGVTTVTTPSFVIGSGTNRAAMIMVAMSGNGATSITASLGGVSGTVIPGTDSGTSATVRTLIFQVVNPPSGAQTATVSWAGGAVNVDVGVITVSGADPVTPVTNGMFSAGDSTPSATRSITVDSNPGDLTASIGHTADSWAAPFTNQTLKWGVDSGLAGGDIGPGTGTTTHTWTDQYYWQSHAVSGASFKASIAP